MLDDIFIGEHTQYCVDLDSYGSDFIDDDIDELFELIYDERLNRSFGEGLLFYMQKHNPEVTADTAIDYLLECCEKNGVEEHDFVQKVTMRSWFESDVCPLHGIDDRKKIYTIAFVIGLTLEETTDFFHKVYLDRAFDLRIPDEIVYYYCMRHGRKLCDAKALLGIIHSNKIKKTDKKIVHTNNIKADIDMINDDDTLLRYVSSHGRNFEEKMISASKIKNELVAKALQLANNKAGLSEKRKKREKTNCKTDGTKREISNDMTSIYKYMSSKSNSFLYYSMTGIKPIGKKGTITVMRRSSAVPKKIRTNFPEARTLSDKTLNYDELRKLIILLCFYIYWSDDSTTEKTVEDFEADTNAYLYECGFSPLYYGNPYDWIFYYCSNRGNREYIEYEEDEKNMAIEAFRLFMENAVDHSIYRNK